MSTALPVLRNFVAGEYVGTLDGLTSDVVDPATGHAYARAPVSNAADVDAAMSAAHGGFETWRASTPSVRQRALLRMADAIEARADEIVAAECRNTGKPIEATRREEMTPLLDELRFFAGAARMLEGRSAGEYLSGYESYVRREPIGVCAQVTPWNYPMVMATWKFAPAIAAGNAVVLKPSDTTPVSTLLLAEIAAEFLPPGVFNVICGDRDTGRALVAHPTPELVSITGSTRAGIEVAIAAAADLKKVHLELGGKAPVVVFDDVDIASAAAAIAGAGYFNAGQDCTAAARVLVSGRIAGDFTAALADAARHTKVGGPDDTTADFGPVNNAVQLDRVRGFLNRTPDHAEVVTGGHRIGDRGYFVEPTVVAGLRQQRRDDPGRDLRPGHHRPGVHRRGRRRPLGQRRPVRPERQCLDPRPRARHADVAAPRLRRRVDQHAPPVRLGDAARRVRALGPRQGPLRVRVRGVHAHQARHESPGLKRT